MIDVKQKLGFAEAVEYLHEGSKLQDYTCDILSMKKENISQNQEVLEKFKGDFSQSYRKMRGLQIKYGLKEHKDFKENTIKRFWDKYCDLKKATLD